jgi:uracil-DNA glycosylase family 4
MILGQDFDSETSYQASLKAGKEDEKKNPTWKNLLAFLEKVGVDRTECFFTNGIMGVRTDDKSTGPSPAFKDEVFLNNCRNFFLEQISIQRPKLILVLGTYTAKFLSATSSDLDCWRVIRTFKAIDEKQNHVKKKVKFKNGIESNLVLLTHPSFRPVNVGRRIHNELKGDDAEIAMVKSILT